MKKTKLRALIIVFCTVLAIAIILLFINNINNKNEISNKIIEYINNNRDENNTCRFSMSDVTDFKWDKMLIYQVGSSNKEISNLLGVPFNDSLDLASGIIFVYNNKIVYKEQLFYNPDRPNKLLLYIGTLYDQPEYGVFTPNNALFEGIREESDENISYQIIPAY